MMSLRTILVCTLIQDLSHVLKREREREAYIKFAAICDEPSARAFFGCVCPARKLVAFVALDAQGDVQEEAEHQHQRKEQGRGGRGGKTAEIVHAVARLTIVHFGSNNSV